VALVSIAVAQALMVGLMGVAPITLRGRGGSALAVSLIISLHLAGMFVFSPLVGSILDRWGRRPSLFVGAALSGAGALAGSLGGSLVLAGAGLFLVGVGWSFAYLGATAVVSDVTTPAERAGGLGFTDLLTSLTAATGALTGGSLLQAAGFDVLGRTLAALVVPVFVLLLFVREIAPGRWAHVGELPTPVPQGAAGAGAATPVPVPVPDAGAGCWLPATLPVEASMGTGRPGGE
jgi:MFS family permease